MNAAIIRAPRVPAGPNSLASIYARAIADPVSVEGPVTPAFDIEYDREDAIDHIVAVFCDDAQQRILRHVAHAAFMRGAWAGRAVGSALPIVDLQQKDHEAVIAQIQARAVAMVAL